MLKCSVYGEAGDLVAVVSAGGQFIISVECKNGRSCYCVRNDYCHGPFIDLTTFCEGEECLADAFCAMAMRGEGGWNGFRKELIEAYNSADWSGSECSGEDRAYHSVITKEILERY